MTDKNKLRKLRELADAMYNAAFNLTTDASHLRRAMVSYHNFILQHYNDEEPVSEDLEEEALVYSASDTITEDGKLVIDSEKVNAFKAGAKWQEKQDQSTIELAEDHAMLAGMEKMKEEMMAKAIDAKIGSFTNGTIYDADFNVDSNLKDNDKVKIIVIKED